ncbi:MAG: FAD-dependent oxidoreductase [Alphaproteobacteria bacterium]
MDSVPASQPPVDPTDPYERAAQTFPRLDADMVARMAAFGTEEAQPAGAIIFQRGERSVDFFLVLEGAVEIFDYDACGHPNVFTVHGEHQFTGELDLFNDRQILVSGRTGTDSRLIRVRRPDFHRLIAAEPDIGEVITRAFILRRVGLVRHAQGGVVLLGPGHGLDTIRLQRFLTRNNYPHRLVDSDSDPAAADLIGGYAIGADQLPAVIHDGRVIANPETPALADALGLTSAISPDHVHDLAVVGAGPAGQAAAVYAASEGLDTIVVESTAPGGQAGTSSKIENYLGFPTGISGPALAGRAHVQAQKFGARFALSRQVVSLDCDRAPYRLALEDGQVLSARAVVIATGARYRKLDVPGYERFEGQGIHYAATAMEAELCRFEETIVVGGGNSAGQAAVFLSRTCNHVHVLVRGSGLADTMSRYLIERIEASPKITLHARTEITTLIGGDVLRAVAWSHRDSGETVAKPIRNLFVMIGAAPNTEWLRGCVTLDGKGFVLTGEQGSPYATSQPGVFAVGDVRSGSVKRVASGVGEGSVVVQAIHRFLDPGLG